MTDPILQTRAVVQPCFSGRWTCLRLHQRIGATGCQAVETVVWTSLQRPDSFAWRLNVPGEVAISSLAFCVASKVTLRQASSCDQAQLTG